MWSTTVPAHCSSSDKTVVSVTQLVSVAPGCSVPPPVTRHCTTTVGGRQSTHWLHWLGAVVMVLPLMSRTHGIDLLATAVPCTTTVMFVPGQDTSTQPSTKFVVTP